MSKKPIQFYPAVDLEQLNADIPAVLKKIFLNRGVTSVEQLNYHNQHLLSYQHLLNIDAATALLYQALSQQWRVLIVADFDADGATSCAVAVKALRAMGLQQIHTIVPNRFQHGYGLTPTVVDWAAEQQPDLIITVDNGISSIAGVARANDLGIKVLITDHHLQGARLPDAHVIINPNQQGDEFPSKNLAGVGVIFYVMLALRAHLRQQNWFDQQQMPVPNLADLLDLVALGTVADMVPLDYNNRILVQQGLLRIRANQCCAGMRALLQVTNRPPSHVTASDLAFYLAPRLNAAGRMETMSHGIDCLLADDFSHAIQKAHTLDYFNQQRKEVEARMQEQALAHLAELDLETNHLPFGLCLYQPHWHSGVIGIVASRIKDRFHRPVVIFTQADENPAHIRGSARSVAGVHIRDILETINSQQPELIDKFGGHAMAAGLTLQQQHLDLFKDLFDQHVRQHLSVDALAGVIVSDGGLSADELNLDFAHLLYNISPWGQAFAKPLFSNWFLIQQRQMMRQKHCKLQLQLASGGQSVEAIAFNVDEDFMPPVTVVKIYLTYQLDINVFHHQAKLQLLIKDLRWH